MFVFMFPYSQTHKHSLVYIALPVRRSVLTYLATYRLNLFLKNVTTEQPFPLRPCQHSSSHGSIISKGQFYLKNRLRQLPVWHLYSKKWRVNSTHTESIFLYLLECFLSQSCTLHYLPCSQLPFIISSVRLLTVQLSTIIHPSKQQDGTSGTLPMFCSVTPLTYFVY